MRKPIRSLVAGVAALLSLAGVGIGLVNNVTQQKQTVPKKVTTELPKFSKIADYEMMQSGEIIKWYRTALPYQGGKRVMYVGGLDKLGRTTGAHIQVGLKDLPKADRGQYLTTSPSGWHNYKVSYKGKKVWLMNRGHLVGYQFSGLDDVKYNLVTETAWLNQGSANGMDASNKNAMLYYEDNLRQWVNTHPDYVLDYAVTPVYKDKELVPRWVILSYSGYTNKGKKVEIKFHSKLERYKNGVSSVALTNWTPAGKISYKTGKLIK